MDDTGYLACSIYREHGACSCSTGVPGNVCPLRDDDEFSDAVKHLAQAMDRFPPPPSPAGGDNG